jgi:hypothetical protein
MHFLLLVVAVLVVGISLIIALSTATKAVTRVSEISKNLGLKVSYDSGRGFVRFEGAHEGRPVRYELRPPRPNQKPELVVTLDYGSPIKLTIRPQTELTELKVSFGTGRDLEIGVPELDDRYEIDAPDTPLIRKYLGRAQVQRVLESFHPDRFLSLSLNPQNILYKENLRRSEATPAHLREIVDALGQLAHAARQVGAERDSSSAGAAPVFDAQPEDAGLAPDEGAPGALQPETIGQGMEEAREAVERGVESAEQQAREALTGGAPPGGGTPQEVGQTPAGRAGETTGRTAPAASAAGAGSSAGAPVAVGLAGARAAGAFGEAGPRGDEKTGEAGEREREATATATAEQTSTAEETEALLEKLASGELDPRSFAREVAPRGPKAMEKCVDKLSDFSARDRVKKALSAMGSAPVAALAKRAGDYRLSYEVRDVLISIGRQGSRPLITQLQDAEDPKAIELLLEVIGRTKMADAKDAVAAHLTHPEMTVRFQAKRTLTDLGLSTTEIESLTPST